MTDRMDGLGGPSRAALVAEDVQLRLNGVQILDHVSLSVSAGEFIALIGPNGAGKTSFLNAISGTVFATGGKILIYNQEVTSRSPSRRAQLGVGRTFQTSYLFDNLTVIENVRLALCGRSQRALSAIRLVRAGDRLTVDAGALLDRVGLSDRLETKAGSLSHGEKRKVEIAMLLATEPSLMLLDEPMAGVSIDDIQPLSDLIRRIHAETGATIVMVEHNMEVVMGLAKKVAVLHYGQLLAFDEPGSVMTDDRVQTAYLGEPI